MLKFRRVISGGQTGADKAGLVCARAIGLETGGTAPKGWRTDEGPDPTLADYGLIESASSDYKPRTVANVRNSDATMWFGSTGSPGFWCTKNACTDQQKQFYVNPHEEQLKYICANYKTVNCAGNRKRLNSHVIGMVQDAFKLISKILNNQSPIEAQL